MQGVTTVLRDDGYYRTALSTSPPLLHPDKSCHYLNLVLEHSSFLHHYSVQFHHNNNFDNKTQFGRCSFRTTKVLFQIWPEGNVKYLATVHGLDAK